MAALTIEGGLGGAMLVVGRISRHGERKQTVCEMALELYAVSIDQAVILCFGYQTV